MKNQLARNIGQREIFIEALPTLFILAFIGWDPEAEKIFIEDDNYEYAIFSVCTSLLSASLGLAKCLLTGPCRILPAMSGFCTCQFILVFISCLFSVVGKASVVGMLGRLSAYFSQENPGVKYFIILLAMLQLLPGFLYAFWCTYCACGILVCVI